MTVELSPTTVRKVKAFRRLSVCLNTMELDSRREHMQRVLDKMAHLQRRITYDVMFSVNHG